MENGAITGFASEPGAYEWSSQAQDSQGIFSGDGFVSPLITTSWERFKFGGRPQAQQQAFFVTLKELPNNRFGTQSEIYWDDAYLNAQVGAITRGTYTLKIVDPILFVKNWMPAAYLQNGNVFDFTDMNNDAATQLFNEVVGSLAPAFSMYTNDPAKGNRITRIQQDSIGFAQSLSAAVETNYQWLTGRGLQIAQVALVSIEYDANTRELLKTVQRADALSGARGNSNLQASVAQGFQSAGETGGPGGILGIGFAAGATGLGGLQQPVPGVGANSAAGSPGARAAPHRATAPAADDPIAVLTRAKQMLDAGLITQQDYDAAKAKALGL